jgi:hypothetical protein
MKKRDSLRVVMSGEKFLAAQANAFTGSERERKSVGLLCSE